VKLQIGTKTVFMALWTDSAGHVRDSGRSEFPLNNRRPGTSRRGAGQACRAGWISWSAESTTSPFPPLTCPEFPVTLTDAALTPAPAI
jgi:hypothetical protein